MEHNSSRHTVVLKFGGTSMGSAEALTKVVYAVQREARKFERVVVVCSACSGITASLREIADSSERLTWEDIQSLIIAVEKRHELIAIDLFLGRQDILEEVLADLHSRISELRSYCEGVHLLRECTSESRAHIMGYGERLSTILLHGLLRISETPAVLIDARTFVYATGEPQQSHANIDRTRSSMQLVVENQLAQGKVVVTQGFIAANEMHRTVLLGIGGSDVSAAVLGAALHADEIQIWTDVSGIYSTDPRIVKGASPVPAMTYEEAGELAYFGAKVLHPDTIQPAIHLGIPVRILNTFAPEETGTTLLPKERIEASGLRAVALRRSCVLVHCALRPHVHKMKFMSLLYGALDEAGIEVLLSQGTERHHTVCVAEADFARIPRGRFERLAVVAYEKVALLCACGPDLSRPKHNPIGHITTVLAEYGLHTVQQSSDNVSIVAAIPEQFAEAGLQAIHNLID